MSHDHHGDNLDAAGRALLPATGAVVTTASGSSGSAAAPGGWSTRETTQLKLPGRPSIEIGPARGNHAARTAPRPPQAVQLQAP